MPGGARTLRDRIAARRLRPVRPRLRFELVLIGIGYWVYNLVRNAVPQHAETAKAHANLVWDLERSLGLAFERSVNHGLDAVTWVIVGMNYYYATLHFVITIAVLVWLYRSHPGRYPAVRTALAAATGIALVGYYVFPMAPPRMLPGFIDTVTVHHTWGSLASGAGATISNQYAAMPSMHFGWALWCGLTVFFLSGRAWLRALGLLYPLFTLTVIIATANHLWLDAAGGAVCLGVGFVAARLLFHRWAYRFPRIPASWQAAGPRVAGQWPVPGEAAARRR
ncbi:phosphatase PAP2 family protein [Kitasatospora sp. NPDC059599]|uniref:phosphatase PAP2 family protein n=1 Tax=Kitasatospora sp. NPDC059599 TaxID=3346880 RepID=UPI0036CC620C